MQSSAPYVTVESNRVMPAQRRPCVVRSFQIYEWVRSGKPQANKGGSLLGILRYLSIRIFLVMTDLLLCVRIENVRQKTQSSFCEFL